MSNKKQTFVDPKTGEEMESTWLARGSVFLGCGLVYGLVMAVLVSLGVRVLWADLVGAGLFVGWMVLMGLGIQMERVRQTPFLQRIHDPIARAQHRRRQHILRNQEHQVVPNTALSRAQPPGEPTPTDAALSIADDPDEPGRLTVETQEDTEDQVPVRQ